MGTMKKNKLILITILLTIVALLISLLILKGLGYFILSLLSEDLIALIIPIGLTSTLIQGWVYIFNVMDNREDFIFAVLITGACLCGCLASVWFSTALAPWVILTPLTFKLLKLERFRISSSLKQFNELIN